MVKPHQRVILSGYSLPPNIDYKDLGLLGNVRKGVELADLDRRMRWRVTALLEPAPSL